MKELLIVLLLLGRAVYSDNQIAEENDAISSVQQAQELIRELTPKRKPQYNGIEFSGVYTTNGTCGYIDRERRFMYLIRRECPISYETLAVDGFLYDPMGFIRYRCHNYRPAEFIENKVYMLSASQLLKIINNPPKDQYRRNWCMITFFYSPKCVFSEELAPAVNAIPFNFPRIVSVAVDATHFSRLNTRYGIAGTPTLLLWINGVPISRMDDRELNNTGLMGFLDEWTDVESLRVTDNEELPLVIRHEPNQTHWETPMAILTLLLVGTYYCRSWFFHRAPMSNLLQRFGTNPDDVCAYFNAM